ncbi:AraC family transcriptional regulator [Marinobacterium jannaschii]|uniref:AraC family transcriptional regulator n=1 Tax=Marinobacterium jannaschii TaxID=64970 RepID=UPI000AEBB2AC|nr:helix-turn-helix transcriptional regulator [Marinobacterium jannaschii]
MRQGIEAMKSTSGSHIYASPFQDQLPAPLFYRAETMLADSCYPEHSHRWGEFVYSFCGVMEVKLANNHFIAPPPYGVWLPPGTLHVGQNRDATSYCSVYISAEYLQTLPQNPCILAVNPLMRSILEYLRDQFQGLPLQAEDQRLLLALRDQLARAECAGSYLPDTEDPLLAPVLRQLRDNPGDNRSLAAFASAVNTAERTLIRRCKQELGMTFTEWRQRLRIMAALSLLSEGQTVENIALDLGYSSASAFIVMFRKLMGMTPDEFRKGQGR